LRHTVHALLLPSLLALTRSASAHDSWRSRQFARWFDVRTATAAIPVGAERGIVPRNDPGRIRRGAEAAFEVAR
jgi:hypothetical protein